MADRISQIEHRCDPATLKAQGIWADRTHSDSPQNVLTGLVGVAQEFVSPVEWHDRGPGGQRIYHCPTCGKLLRQVLQGDASIP